jgi:hypothetical protein
VRDGLNRIEIENGASCFASEVMESNMSDSMQYNTEAYDSDQDSI